MVKDKIKVTITVKPDNYRAFQKLAKSMGVSVSALLDVVMYICVRYVDNIDEILRVVIRDSVLDEVKELLGIRVVNKGKS